MAEMFIAKQCQVEPEVNQKQLLKDIKNLSLNNSKFSINYNRCGKV